MSDNIDKSLFNGQVTSLDLLRDQGREPVTRKRSKGEEDRARRLAVFIAGYVRRLPKDQQELLEMDASGTSSDLLSDGWTSRQSISSRRKTARRALIRLIAESNPRFEPEKTTGRGRPKRNYALEESAAWEVVIEFIGRAA